MVDDRLHLAFVSTRFLFPADSGGKIRTGQILRGMKGGQFRISLLMPGNAIQQKKFSGQIDDHADRVVFWNEEHHGKIVRLLRNVLLFGSRYPIPVVSDSSAAGKAAVLEILGEEPDVIVFDFPHSVILAPDKLEVPSVIFTHNVETEIFDRHRKLASSRIMRLVWNNQWQKMQRFERQALTRFDAVVAVSEKDRDYFRQEWQIDSCFSIPTGVDLEFFQYSSPRDARQVIFCGSMDWMANIDAVEFFFDNVWPLIIDRITDARMKVVGRAPPDALVAKVRASSPEWEFTGFVDDIRDHVCGAAAFVIPLRVGSGTRIKAFEAMAMGCPVVSTTVGVEGLPVEDGTHYLRADDPSDMADCVVTLLNDSERRNDIALAARQHVEAKFGFQEAARVFEEICLRAAGRAADAKAR